MKAPNRKTIAVKLNMRELMLLWDCMRSAIVLSKADSWREHEDEMTLKAQQRWRNAVKRLDRKMEKKTLELQSKGGW